MTIRLLCCSGSLDGGGSEHQLWQLATGVDRARFLPQFYLHYRRGQILQRVPAELAVHDFWSEFQSGFFKIPGQIHRTQINHLRSLIEREQIDVVYDRTFHMTLVTAPACRASHCPRVSVIVSPPTQDFQRSRERFSFVKKWLLRRAYADPLGRTLAVSECVADDASRFYHLDRASIEVVESPVDIDAVVQASRVVPAGLEAASGVGRVCVVGRMSPEKGQRLAIEAFDRAARELQDRRLVLDLVGDGPDRLHLEALAQSLPAGPLIKFHGFQDNPYPFMSAADVLLIPSDYEGLPNVALESMSLETAVIATDCSGSLRQLLGDGDGSRGQIVSLRDAEGLAQAIVDRFEQSERWRIRVGAAYEYVLQHHSLQPWLARMERLLAEQVERHRSAATA